MSTSQIVNSSAAHRVLAPPLVRRGLAKHGAAYARQRPDGLFVLFEVQRARKTGQEGIAAAFAIHAGLGTTPSADDMRTSALRPLACVLGDGPACEAMCRVHNEIVDAWGALGPEGERARQLLLWNVQSSWRNAPEVLWCRTTIDLDRWAAFLDAHVEAAIDRLCASRLDTTRPALGLRLA